jgi:hypothetical protein
MALPMTDEERSALGIEFATTGEVEMVLLPTAAEGRTGTARALATLAAASSFSTPRIDAAGRVGMRVSVSDERPSVVRVIDEASQPVTARSAGAAGAWIEHDLQDPGTVFVDLELAPLVSVGRTNGSGLVLRRDGRGLFIGDFYPPPLATAPLAPVRAPIESWCQGDVDLWLVDQVKQYAGTDDSWRQAVAAGIFARLRQVGLEARETIARLLAGDLAVIDDRPRAWARDLSAQQVETLVDFALVIADRVEGTLDDLWAHMAPGEKWWVATFRSAAIERDDLESVRLLLVERGVADRVQRTLNSIDHRGREMVAGIPRVVSIEDERLYRARLADPEAWWARLAEAEVRK